MEPSGSRTFADLYPERRGGRVEFSRWEWCTGRANEGRRRICQEHLISCVEKMPMVRNILGAMRAHGCEMTLDRNFSCDMCSPGGAGGVGREAGYGGYDEGANQVFVCANNARSEGKVHGTLVRALLAAFDSCVARVDHRNVDHLACTEVRKANLANCNLGAYWRRTDAHFAVKGRHADCVRKTAVDGMVDGRFVDRAAAEEAVDRVFDRCYADLEPVGRRAWHPNDLDMANDERFLAGYR